MPLQSNYVACIKNVNVPIKIIYTTLPHNLIKDKPIDLIEITFKREGSAYLACNDRTAFLLRKSQNVCDALTFFGQHFI